MVGLFTCVGAYIADYSDSHIFNPRWPPHAKFHTGQTMSMALALGVATLYYLWRPVKAEASKENLNIVATFASLYWATQLSAILYPGTRFTDPEFGDSIFQVYLDAVMFTLIGIGYVFEARRIAAAEKVAKA